VGVQTDTGVGVQTDAGADLRMDVDVDVGAGAIMVTPDHCPSEREPIGGKIYAPLGGWYHATKFAVEGLSDSLRLELAPFGIDVVLIEPGPIITGWNTIARTNLVERSAHGPYAAQAASVGSTLASADRPGRGSRPDVVGRRIARAATAAHPRPRYPAGRGAGTAVRARRMLPDRVFDRVIARVYGLS